MEPSQILMSNYPYYKYSLDYTLDSLALIGASAIEFYACYPHFHVDDMGYRDVKVLADKLASHHLSVVCFTPEQCLYPVNIAAVCPAARKRSMAVFQKSIQYAAELGAELVLVLAGYGTLDEKEEHAWQRSVESLGILSDMAEAYGIQLVLETSPREYTTTHDANDVVRMIQEVKSPALKGMIDTATLGFSQETMDGAIAALGTYLRHVHVGDGVPNGHLILGEGNLDIQGMMKSLKAANYSYALSLEILNDRYIREPEKAMQISYEKLKSYLV